MTLTVLNDNDLVGVEGTLNYISANLYRKTLNIYDLVAQLVKNLPAMQETLVPPLGWEDSLEKGKATHSSNLAWKIPMDCIVHGVTKSRTELSDFHFHFATLLNSLYHI